MDFYHLVNRGVDKRKVFMSSADYARFIHDLWEFNDITPAPHNLDRRIQTTSTPPMGGAMGDVGRHPLVTIHFFCLMPNHYHLLVSPVDDEKEKLSLFMKKLNGGYSKYFNEKYERSGALWQGKYRSVPIEGDAHFLYIPYYIHFNALDLKFPEWRTQCPAQPKAAEEFLRKYRWSSHLDYLGEKNFPSVTDRAFFLNYFGGSKKYVQSIQKMLQAPVTDTLESATLE